MSETQDPLISIIVPVYMAENSIDRCIESVLQQTYPNFELLLLDDGSEDHSLAKMNAYAKADGRIKVFHKKNGGQSETRNVGLEMFQGDYVVFLDSDDSLELIFLEKMLHVISEGEVDLAICGINRIYHNSREKIGPKENTILNGKKFVEKLLDVQSGYGFVWVKIWKTESIKNIRFNPRIKIAEDALFSIEASTNIKSVRVIEEPLYNYYFNEKSTVRKFNPNYVVNCVNSVEAAQQVLRKNKYFSGIDNHEKKFADYVSYHVLLIVVNYCAHPQNKKSLQAHIRELEDIATISIFKSAIDLCNYKNFSISRKIPLAMLKYHLYFLTFLIGKIRQKQFQTLIGR